VSRQEEIDPLQLLAFARYRAHYCNRSNVSNTKRSWPRGESKYMQYLVRYT